MTYYAILCYSTYKYMSKTFLEETLLYIEIKPKKGADMVMQIK